nr:hypothetical protein [Tanacetum cinerariifolium]
NKSFSAFHVKSVGSTAPLEKCCEIRKLDNMSYHVRDTGESAKSIALGAAATGTGKTTIVGGLKYSSNIGCCRSHTLKSGPEMNCSEAIAVSSSNVT